MFFFAEGGINRLYKQMIVTFFYLDGACIISKNLSIYKVNTKRTVTFMGGQAHIFVLWKFMCKGVGINF